MRVGVRAGMGEPGAYPGSARGPPIKQKGLSSSVTRLGAILSFGQFFEGLGKIFFHGKSPKFGALLGEFLKRVKIFIFYVLKTLANHKKLNFHKKFVGKFGQKC